MNTLWTKQNKTKDGEFLVSVSESELISIVSKMGRGKICAIAGHMQFINILFLQLLSSMHQTQIRLKGCGHASIDAIEMV